MGDYSWARFMKIFLFIAFIFLSPWSFAQSDFDVGAKAVIRAKLEGMGYIGDDVLIDSTLLELKKFMIKKSATIDGNLSLGGTSSFLRAAFATTAYVLPFVFISNESTLTVTQSGLYFSVSVDADRFPPESFTLVDRNLIYTIVSGQWEFQKPSANVYSSRIGATCLSGCSTFPSAPASARFYRNFNAKDYSSSPAVDVERTIACDVVADCANAEVQYHLWNRRLVTGYPIRDVSFNQTKFTWSGTYYVPSFYETHQYLMYGYWFTESNSFGANLHQSVLAQLQGTMAQILGDDRMNGEFIPISRVASFFSDIWLAASVDADYKGFKIDTSISDLQKPSSPSGIFLRNLVDPISVFASCAPPRTLSNNVCYCPLPNIEKNGVCTPSPPPPSNETSVVPDIGGVPDVGTGSIYVPPVVSDSGDLSGSLGGDTAWMGVNPNISTPSLEETPTAQSIISQVFGFLPTFKNFSVMRGGVSCPKFSTLELWGRVFVIDSHCQLAEDNRQSIGSLSVLFYSVFALFIVLKA